MESNRRKFLSTGIGAGVAGVALGAPAIVLVVQPTLLSA